MNRLSPLRPVQPVREQTNNVTSFPVPGFRDRHTRYQATPDSPAMSDAEREAFAAGVIRAGQIRRGEAPADADAPEPGSLAAEILRMGRVRRGEE